MRLAMDCEDLHAIYDMHRLDVLDDLDEAAAALKETNFPTRHIGEPR